MLKILKLQFKKHLSNSSTEDLLSNKFLRLQQWQKAINTYWLADV